MLKVINPFKIVFKLKLCTDGFIGYWSNRYGKQALDGPITNTYGAVYINKPRHKST